MKRPLVLVRRCALAALVAMATDASAADLRVGDSGVVEGNGGTRSVEILVTLSAAATAPVTADYTTRDGSAAGGSDYVTASGMVTFARGEIAKRISVSVVGDLSVEANETFAIVLSNPSGATVAQGTGTVTILNDDIVAGAGKPSLGSGRLLPMYEVRLTFVGYTGDLQVDGCPVRPDGKVVMTGIITGDESVPGDEDIEYKGTLQLDIDIDACDVYRKPNGEDDLCRVTIISSGSIEATLAVYADSRGGYVQTTDGTSRLQSAFFGSCPSSRVADERSTFPDNNGANYFNGLELSIPSGPLRVGRYVGVDEVFEVLRAIR